MQHKICLFNKALGLKSRYRVDVFTGIKLFKSNRASSYQCGYDKAIFPLYRSYEAGNGKELTIDKRQNVLASSRLWWTVAGLLLLPTLSVNFLVRFFTHVQGPDPQVTSPAPSNAAVTMSPSVAVAAPPKPVMSSSWRVAGRLAKAGQVWVLLADNNGRLRVEQVSLFTFEGVMMTGVIDGERVTVWSGGVKG
ncbi:hypothetical protein [Symbiopectobacterium sp. RP]|uniref:hypothetical protein n=1 Tax=Symbiopectobacterium sp. RP TaxID=3248553 RepID=UPI003D2854AD